jgi:HAD superfamily hydrolase (TIGR01509 family)
MYTVFLNILVIRYFGMTAFSECDAVIFDLDGTIIEPALAEVELFKSLSAQGIPYAQIMKDVLSSTASSVTDSLISAQIRLLELGYKADSGFFDLFEKLRSRGVKIGLCTSSSSSMTSAVVEALGVTFDAVVTSDDVRLCKPDPEPYVICLQKLGCKKGIAVEDSALGIRSAKEAGLYVIGKVGEYGTRDEVSQADEVVRTLSEISLE